MSGGANDRVLRRCEAEQLLVDLSKVSEKITSIAAEASESDKVLAMDALVILQNKRNTVEDEIMLADAQAAKASEGHAGSGGES